MRPSKDDAEKLIKRADLVLTKHFRRELQEERLDIVDVQHVIRRGYVCDEPEFNPATGEWNYRLHGTATDGQFVTIVFCPPTEEEAVLITIFTDPTAQM